MYQFNYSPIALIEYKDSVIWYKKSSTKAAENFVKEVREKIRNICETPFSYPKTYGKFRETSLKKYPYSIVYFIDENIKMIIVTSVFHQKRNPQNKFLKK